MLKKLILSLTTLLFLPAVLASSSSTVPLPGQGQPMIVPSPPYLGASTYLLMDVNSGKVLAEHNVHDQVAPASLTKMMTMYIVSDALKNANISLEDKVDVSNKAWKAEGARMFLKAGTRIPVKDIIQGIVVDSANDACIAIAEHIAGTENAFVDMMNEQAQRLGMSHTHFMNSTGMPNPDHYSTAFDMAILGRTLIQNFPEEYEWYKQKWFTFNEIKQPNRNRLLWRTSYIDGIKTGHTDEAGYCLVASGEKNNMRLLSVVMGSQSDNARAEDSQRLFNWGFRFYEAHKLYKAGEVIKQAKIWNGKSKSIPITVSNNLNITIPTGQYKNLHAKLELNEPIKAPVKKGQSMGKINISLNGETVTQQELISLQDVDKGGIFKRTTSTIALTFHRIFHG